MSIQLQTSESLLLKNNGTSIVGGNSGDVIPRAATSFGDVLNNQVTLFKIEDGKQSLNTAKLLSQDVTHANQLINQSKNYNQSNTKPIRAFEANVHQAEYILAMKNIAESKQTTFSATQISTLDKFNQGNCRLALSGSIYSSSYLTVASLPRSLNGLHQNIDKYAFDVADDSIENLNKKNAEEEMALKSGDEFSGDAQYQRKSHDQSQDSDESSVDEMESLSALAMSPGTSNVAKDINSSGVDVIRLRMQSSISSPEWIQELAQKTIVMFGSDKHTAVITLNSPDKGSLKIVLHVKGDEVCASFYSSDLDILQAIQEGSSNLKSSMLEAGLILNQLNVSSDNPYSQRESEARGNLKALNGKLESSEMSSTKIVNFYV